MTPTDFKTYFEGIAALHQGILHHAVNSPRFMQVVQSVDPITGMWTSDFQNALRNKVRLDNKACFVLEHYDSNTRYNAPNNILMEGTAAFIILKKPAKDIDAQMAAVAECQTIGEQIIAKIEEDCRTRWHAGNATTALFLQFDALSNFSVTNVSDLWGRRFEFSFLVPQGDTLLYSAVPFTPTP